MKQQLKLLTLVGMIAGICIFAYAAFAPTPAEAQVSPPLRNLWVVVQTSTQSNAGTDSDFVFEFEKADSTWFFLNPSNLSWDEDERGRTETYGWNIANRNLRAADFYNKICIAMNGSDAWLLQSIWVLGETTNGQRFLLASQPHWPTNAWLSKDTSEGSPVRSLYGSSNCG